jgi:MFS family permease
MFCSVTQLPVLLAQAPYGPTGHGMSPGTIGLACLSASAAGIIAAPIGGRIADFSAAVHGQHAHPLQRLMYNNALNLVLKPLGLLLYGWTAQYKMHVALPLVGMFLIGVSNNVYLPGILSYVTNYRPQSAAAAAAGIHSVMCVASGVLVMFGAVAVQALGSGWMFTILAALNVVVSLAAAIQICACSGISNWQQLREFSSSSFRMVKELQLLQEAGEIGGAPAPAAAAAAAATDAKPASGNDIKRAKDAGVVAAAADNV